MKQIRMFVLVLAIGFCMWGTFKIAQIWYVKFFGQEANAIVVRNWTEKSTSYNTSESGNSTPGNTFHLDLALLEHSEAQTQSTDLTIYKNSDTEQDDNKEAISKIRNDTQERFDSMFQSIRNSYAPAEIPENAPKFTLNVSEKTYKEMYTGRKLKVKRVGENIWLEAEYQTIWSESGLILIALGSGLALISIFIRK